MAFHWNVYSVFTLRLLGIILFLRFFNSIIFRFLLKKYSMTVVKVSLRIYSSIYHTEYTHIVKGKSLFSMLSINCIRKTIIFLLRRLFWLVIGWFFPCLKLHSYSVEFSMNLIGCFTTMLFYIFKFFQHVFVIQLSDF